MLAMIASVLVFWTKYRDRIVEEDFSEKLKLAAAALAQEVQNHQAARNNRHNTMAALSKARSDAKTILSRLDPIVENLFRDDGPVLGEWDAARSVHRARKVKKAVAQEAPATKPAAESAAVTTTSAP